MFLPTEIVQLKKLINVNVTAQDVLNDDEQKAVVSTTKTKIDCIKDRLIIPSHNKNIKTITLVKVITADLDCTKFLEKIIKSLKPSFELRIGFSFFMSNLGKYSYVHSIVSKPVNETTNIRTRIDGRNLIDFFKGLTHSDLLSLAFQSRNVDNPFDKSGYSPVRLVCITAWITKHKD